MKNMSFGFLLITIFSSNFQAFQLLFPEHIASYVSSKDKEIAVDAFLDKDDLEVTELDVERVIQKQDTHDFYCPNCNSCITKRIILRKRKRTVQISDEDVKKVKEATVAYKLGSESTESTGEPVEAGYNVAQNEMNNGADIFRCLSCFSFFIPTCKNCPVWGESRILSSATLMRPLHVCC